MAKKAAQMLKGDGEEKLASILEGVDITDEDTIESVSKKHQKQIKDLVGYFNDRLDSVKSEAVEESTRDTRAAREKEIKDFEKDHKGMENAEVIAIMQPLYDKGEAIEKCYAKACRALELDPKTGVAPKEETAEEKVVREKEEKEKKAKDKPTKTTSHKSTLSDDEGDEDDSDKKGDKPLSIEESLEANANTLLANPKFEGLFPE